MRLTYADGDNVPLAVLAIALTVLALSFGDAIIKLISAQLPLWQMFVIRSALATPVVLAMMRVRRRGVPLMPRQPAWTLLRSVMLVLMWVAYYASLPHVALSAAAAVYYTLPLFITLFAATFARESVGTWGWVAVILGFTGVLLILKPQTGDFNAYALLPLAAAILYALSMLLTRTKCREEHPLALSLALNAVFIGVGLLATLALWLFPGIAAGSGTYNFVTGGWIAMGSSHWLALALLALLTIIGSVGAAIAYQAGPSSIVATFDFAYLAFATLWGLVFFAEVPDLASAGGILLIAMAGIIAVRRKQD